MCVPALLSSICADTLLVVPPSLSNLVPAKQIKWTQHFVDIKMATYKRLRIRISFNLSRSTKRKRERRHFSISPLSLSVDAVDYLSLRQRSSDRSCKYSISVLHQLASTEPVLAKKKKQSKEQGINYDMEKLIKKVALGTCLVFFLYFFLLLLAHTVAGL